MENLFIFVGVVLIIMWVAFYFKMWKMANDVNAIKSMNTASNDEFMFAYLMDDKTKCKEILIRKFINTLNNEYKTNLNVNDNTSVEKYKNELSEKFKMIGENVPSWFNKINTFKDFDELKYMIYTF